MRRLALVLAVGLMSCGPELAAPVQPAQSRAPIVNGTQDNGDPSVVFLYFSSGASCTGELIGPQTVLTAGHCTDPAEIGNGTTIYAFWGTNPDLQSSNADYVVADDYQHHPSYTGSNQQNLAWHDIGLIHLSSPHAGPYLPINRTPLENVDLSGKAVRLVGYGITGSGQMNSGLKRQVTKHDVTTISGDTDEITYAQTSTDPGNSCSGDSGGPALFTFPDGVEYIIGVTSRGDTSCSQEGIDTRPDDNLAFIQSFMSAHNDLPSCGADGRCGFNCSALDPDCPCAADGFCTAACPNPAWDPDCPVGCGADGDICVASGCPVPDPDCIADGAPCNESSRCISHRCAYTPDQSQLICMEPCEGGQSCPDGTRCVQDGSNHMSCVPGATPPGSSGGSGGSTGSSGATGTSSGGGGSGTSGTSGASGGTTKTSGKTSGCASAGGGSSAWSLLLVGLLLRRRRDAR